MRWWNSYFFNMTPSLSQKSAIYSQGTGASFSQTSLANQPKVNKHRLKLQKTKIRAYLCSPMCISALPQIFGSNVGGPTWTWQEKNKALDKKKNCSTAQPRPERGVGPRPWTAVNASLWVSNGGQPGQFLVVSDTTAVRRAIVPLLVSPLLPADRWAKTGGRSATTAPPIHHHNKQTQHSHAALPATGFKIKVIVEMNLLSIRNCLTSFLV